MSTLHHFFLPRIVLESEKNLIQKRKKMISFPKNYGITLFILLPLSFLNAEKAVVVVPVADLFGAPYTQQNKQVYNNPPLSGGTYHFYDSCPRIHQLLFNEI